MLGIFTGSRGEEKKKGRNPVAKIVVSFPVQMFVSDIIECPVATSDLSSDGIEAVGEELLPKPGLSGQTTTPCLSEF